MTDAASTALTKYSRTVAREVQSDLAQKLLVAIKKADASGYPEVYVQGMNRALEVILAASYEDTGPSTLE